MNSVEKMKERKMCFPLEEEEFKMCITDNSLFVKHASNSITILLVYVNDILLTGNDVKVIDELLSTLNKHFDMRNLGLLQDFLSIEFHHHSNGMFLSQQAYAKSILQRAGMTDCKSYSTPSTIKKLSLTDKDPPIGDKALYQSIVGGLQYLTITRPDISFAINWVCQHMHDPKASHYQVVKRIIPYIQGTIPYGLQYTKGSLSLQGFTDGDWASDIVDRRPTSGYCVFIGNNPIA